MMANGSLKKKWVLCCRVLFLVCASGDRLGAVLVVRAKR